MGETLGEISIYDYVIRSGLTINLEPAHEERTFPTTGTINGLLSWNNYVD